MAVKIKLKRLGKIRNPQYRIVIADARNKRDGRSIEEIGLYHPKEEPSFIKIDSVRAQYWLGVGAQPTEAVAVLLKITGDWQKFKGLPGTEGTLRVAEPRVSKTTVFAAAVADSANAKDAPEPKPRAKKEAASTAAAPATEAPATEAPAEEAPSDAASEQEVPAEPTINEAAPASEATVAESAESTDEPAKES